MILGLGCHVGWGEQRLFMHLLEHNYSGDFQMHFDNVVKLNDPGPTLQANTGWLLHKFHEQEWECNHTLDFEMHFIDSFVL